MIKFSVSQNGCPLDSSKYSWSEETRTFSTKENHVVIDFGDESEIIFNTGYGCTFKTRSMCIFNTGEGCTFSTGSNCTFNTGPNCIFRTGFNGIFKTGINCFIIRYDTKGCIEIPEGKTIKLNYYCVSGYNIIET
jgi:hypothetical protein